MSKGAHLHSPLKMELCQKREEQAFSYANERAKRVPLHSPLVWGFHCGAMQIVHSVTDKVSERR